MGDWNDNMAKRRKVWLWKQDLVNGCQGIATTVTSST